MLQRYLFKPFHRTTFRSKLVLTYVIIIVIPVIFALILSGLQLYKQTNSDYEDILAQLNRRTNVTIDDFINNLSRNTFFYLTETRLNSIMQKTKPTYDKQKIDDSNYMHSSLEQFVLINGNIAMISVLAPNGNIYGSKPEKAGEIVNTVRSIGKETLRSSNFVVSVPLRPGTMEHKNEHISIVRYLADLNTRSGKEGYAKIDIFYNAIENMLGGISSKEGLKLGTIVLSGDTIVYKSDGRVDQLTEPGSVQLQSHFKDLTVGSDHISHVEWNKQLYMVSGSINPATGWKIIQYIPVNQIYNTFLSNTLNYVLFGIMALIASLTFAFFFHNYFINPILKLSRAMKTIDTDHLYKVMPWSEREDEIGRLINSYNAMIERLKSSRESEIMSSHLQKTAELKMLQSQINPHFLYNTLNTIHSISELHRIDTISIMTKSLSSIYRYNIKHGDEVTIEKELEQINNYIKIQQIRFYNKFLVEYEISPEVLNYKLLKFLIQPIIENSFYHGLEPKGGAGTLKLTIKRLNHFLFIRIQDNGVGIKEDKLNELKTLFGESHSYSIINNESERNFGLSNVHSRIKYFYGESYGIQVTSSENNGTSITIQIPINKESNNIENTSS